MAKKTAPVLDKPVYSREDSTKFLADTLLQIFADRAAKVAPSEYKTPLADFKKVAGYIDSRRGGLSPAGLNRFSEVPALKEIHDKAVVEYPAKAKAILTDHADILLKMFAAKPGQKSITKEEYALVAPVLQEPLARSDEKGGLLHEAYLTIVKQEEGKKGKTPINAEMAKVIEAAAVYRENIRVNVLSPLYLADIYVRNSSKGTVTPAETSALKEGIIVIENGKQVAKPFVQGGKLTPYGVDACKTASHMLGGGKGKTLQMALTISASKDRQNQVRPPSVKGEDMDRD